MTGFSMEAALALLNVVVAARDLSQPGIEDLGIVAGVLVLNSEPEVVVKFFDHIEQCTKAEFESRYFVVPEHS